MRNFNLKLFTANMNFKLMLTFLELANANLCVRNIFNRQTNFILIYGEHKLYNCKEFLPQIELDQMLLS